MFPTNHKTFSTGRPKALFDETKVSPGASPTTANTEIELKLSADSKSLARVRQTTFWSGSQRAQTRVLDSVTSIQFATTCGPVAFDPFSKGGAAISEISAFKPDLLLTDFVMAQVDGLGPCRELKKRSDFDRMKINSYPSMFKHISGNKRMTLTRLGISKYHSIWRLSATPLLSWCWVSR